MRCSLKSTSINMSIWSHCLGTFHDTFYNALIMKMILMGTGTSHGVPVIGCRCKVCTSPHSEDKRLRCSAYIINPGNTRCDRKGRPFETTNIVIDTGPEFRIQCLKNNVTRLDGVLITHSHADHAHGLDDLRIFSHTRPDLPKGCQPAESSLVQQSYPLETVGPGIPIYANSNTVEDLIFRFAYVFRRKNLGGGLPKLNLLPCDDYNENRPVEIGSLKIIPVPMLHGAMKTSGWILKSDNNHSMLYLTDCNIIPDSSIDLIKRNGGIIDHLVIDGLREREHPTHCSFLQAMAYAERIGARHSWLTHLCHDRFHWEVQEYIDENLSKFPGLSKIVSQGGSVAPAYDGLVLESEQ